MVLLITGATVAHGNGNGEGKVPGKSSGKARGKFGIGSPRRTRRGEKEGREREREWGRTLNAERLTLNAEVCTTKDAKDAKGRGRENA